MDKLRLCLLLEMCLMIAGQKTALDSPVNLQIYRQLRNWIFHNFGMCLLCATLLFAVPVASSPMSEFTGLCLRGNERKCAD